MRQDDVAEDDRRVRAADGRSSPARGRRRLQRAAARAQREHRLPAVRPVPAHVRVRQRGVRPPGEEGRGRRDPPAGDGDARDRAARRVRAASAGADVGWPAAAGRAGPGAGQPPERPAPRRAARRARPQAPRGDADRAQADPARGRHHVRVRHPRPGRGAHDERPHRRHEQGQGRADRHARGDLRQAGEHLRRRIHRIGQPAARDAGQRRRRAGARAPRQRHDGRDDRRDARPGRRPGDGDAAAGAAEPASSTARPTAGPCLAPCGR